MTNEQARKLGRLIYDARVKRGWSCAALSEMTGIQDVWINRVERGLYNQPAPERLSVLAEALDIDPAAMDAASGNYLAQSLPSVRTYFRSKGKATPDEVDEIEAAVADIQARYAKPTDEKAGRP